MTGRWAGTNRIQVRFDDGSHAQVESTTSSADDVDPGDEVCIVSDAAGTPVDWVPYAGER